MFQVSIGAYLCSFQESIGAYMCSFQESFGATCSAIRKALVHTCAAFLSRRESRNSCNGLEEMINDGSSDHLFPVF